MQPSWIYNLLLNDKLKTNNARYWSKRSLKWVSFSERPKSKFWPKPKFRQFRYRQRANRYRYRKRLHTETDTDTETDTERWKIYIKIRPCYKIFKYISAVSFKIISNYYEHEQNFFIYKGRKVANFFFI